MSTVRKFFFILVIILVSALSGIFANRYVFPYLATVKFFSKYSFFKKTTNDVTVINKTEQVYVKDDTSVGKIAAPVISSVVNIISSETIAEKKGQAVLPVIGRNGTGVIVTSDGLIMTYVSAILPQDASYKVITNDSNVYDATLLDIDSYSNLAFLKINASNLSAVSFGNSDDAIIGERVLAIGNSSGAYDSFFATGILNRFNYEYNLSNKTIASSEKMEGIFETDLVQKANFVGGPLVDYSGQMIGLTGENDRDGKTFFFQIPSNKIKIVLNKEIDKTISNNPVLGIYYVPITKTYALLNNLTTQNGAVIYSPSTQQGLAIIASSPAANAGLKLYDIITAVSGDKITDNQTLPDLLYKHSKGEKVELTILRNAQEMKINVQL
jgi:serine protease Do